MAVKLGLVRLVAYDPFGERRGVVPEWSSIEWVNTLNDLPTLKVEVAAGSISARRVKAPCELALEFRQWDAVSKQYSERWSEPSNARFITTTNENDLAHPSGVIRINALGFGQVLRWATVWTPSKGNKDYKRVFRTQTPGATLHDLFRAALVRSDSAGRKWTKNTLTYTWDQNRDSWGKAWGKKADPTFSPSDTLEKVVRWFTNKGAIDWRFQGREFQIARSGGALSQESKIRLLAGQAKGIPVTDSFESIATVAKFHGDEGYERVKMGADAYSGLGMIERWSEQGQVKLDATAELYLDEILEKGKRPVRQWKREWVDDGDTPVPEVDYEVGQWVSVAGERLRIVECGAKFKPDEVPTGWDTLGTRLQSLLEKLARHTTDLSTGMVGSENGSPAPLKDETLVPNAPERLVCSSTVTVGERGEYRAVITAKWDEVTQATNGSSITIDHYEIAYRYEGSSSLHVPVHTKTTQAGFYVEPGKRVEVVVRAVSDKNRFSAWSGPFSLEAAKDTQAPPRPSRPKLSSHLSVIKVNWDGKDEFGERMPPDFSHIEVYVGTRGTADKPTANVTASGLTSWAYPAEPGEYFVALRAVDLSGNIGPWCTPVKVKVTALTDNETVLKEIDEAIARGVSGFSENQNKRLLALEKFDKELAASVLAGSLADSAQGVIRVTPTPPVENVEQGVTIWLSPDGKKYRAIPCPVGH